MMSNAEQVERVVAVELERDEAEAIIQPRRYMDTQRGIPWEAKRQAGLNKLRVAVGKEPR